MLQLICIEYGEQAEQQLDHRTCEILVIYQLFICCIYCIYVSVLLSVTEWEAYQAILTLCVAALCCCSSQFTSWFCP